MCVRAADRQLLLDPSRFAVVPGGDELRLFAHARAVELLLLRVSWASLARAAREAELEPTSLEASLCALWTAPVSSWLEQLCRRYASELCSRPRPEDRARFFELEIIREVYWSHPDRAEAETTLRPAGGDPLVERAKRFIDAHLFELLPMRELAQACHASQSTLLRAFRRATALTPSAYLRRRRLEEAFLLLATRSYSVSEVADRVRYDSLAAFSHAFRAQFGLCPSHVLRAHPAL
ncbi:MAG: helix-turn-helix transcriptional regulator [Deltaproteobacteria bacterium]|nr:helix-turn-helix transcriptional regulator [Deltaproteobacteria bacterium]